MYNFSGFRTPHPRHVDNEDKIWQVFGPDTLRQVCEMPEHEFADKFGMQRVDVPQRVPDNFYAFKDNGSNILAVAHLDTVGLPHERYCGFLDTADGLVVYSRALDDRLGAYVILDLLPRLGIGVDVLLTVGEESGNSTARFFEPPIGKDYHWIIEFDRGGTDVVMYQFQDEETADLVEDSGARMGVGSCSDIAYMEHLGVKAFNWGIGYRDYHGPRSHAYLDDTFMMVAHFMEFHAANKDTRLEHVEKKHASRWDDEDDDVAWKNHDEWSEWVERWLMYRHLFGGPEGEDSTTAEDGAAWDEMADDDDDIDDDIDDDNMISAGDSLWN